MNTEPTPCEPSHPLQECEDCERRNRGQKHPEAEERTYIVIDASVVRKLGEDCPMGEW